MSEYHHQPTEFTTTFTRFVSKTKKKNDPCGIFIPLYFCSTFDLCSYGYYMMLPSTLFILYSRIWAGWIYEWFNEKTFPCGQFENENKYIQWKCVTRYLHLVDMWEAPKPISPTKNTHRKLYCIYVRYVYKKQFFFIYTFIIGHTLTSIFNNQTQWKIFFFLDMKIPPTFFIEIRKKKYK